MQKKIILTFIVLAATTINSFAQKWAVSTNAVDWINFATLNVEGSVAVSRHVAVDVGAKYNPWTFGKNEEGTQQQNRQRTFYVGVKVYPWFIYDGWHFDALAQYMEYNAGGMFKKIQTEEGDAIGGGLGAGYTLPVHKNVNVEFGAGVWAGMKRYRVYECPSCGRIKEEGTKFFVMPNNITIGVTWVFGQDPERKAEKRREQIREERMSAAEEKYSR